MAITHVLFDLDDTLVAEESSAEAAFLATCEHARERYGVDPHALHRAVREWAREAWFAAPTNAYKPDARAFAAALKAAGATPGRTVMVGDSLRRDVQGAQQAGLRAFWLNRHGREREPDVLPDAEMNILSELPALLRRG